MKNFRSLWIAVLAVAVMTSCSDSNEDETQTITFESAQLGTWNYVGYQTVEYEDILCGAVHGGGTDFDETLYSEGVARLGAYYSADDVVWGGFAISSNYDEVALNAWDMGKQFHAFASLASNFAVGYYANFDGADAYKYNEPTITFTMPKVVSSARIANSNMLVSYSTSAKPDFECKLTAIGYRNGEVKADVVDVMLFEGGQPAFEGWKEVSFEELGVVDKVVFIVESNDVSQWGDNAPTYFCIDNIVIR